MSDRRYVKHGTPQGSSLSSLLFLIYINDCLEIPLNGYIQMYADDTVLVYSCANTEQLQKQMQQDLSTINIWMFNNYLCFNASKTKYMIFQRRATEIRDISPIYINNEQICSTSQIKYLGLIIDDKLSWKPHRYRLY